MATVTLDRLTIEPVEVELPEACPGCGQPFDEPDSLVEVGYMASRRTCQLVSVGAGAIEVGDRETSEVEDELALTIGYRCGGCGTASLPFAPPHHVIVMTQEDPTAG